MHQFFFLIIWRTPKFTLFPNPTLFLSQAGAQGLARHPRRLAGVRRRLRGGDLQAPRACEPARQRPEDRKSTRLNSSHSQISYAVFCLKKKNVQELTYTRTLRPSACIQL